ncbi:MAG: UDP-galactopyranose mutase [Firmicutes bacterium]|nr:UDP-galactopyranose mutase [Bacillota bacterium]
MYDVIVVGSGFCGSTISYLAAVKRNKKVLVLEKRRHIGGNMFDEINSDGIRIHKYGPHIVHTNNYEVYSFLKGLSEWQTYITKCRAVIDCISTPTPFNFETIDTFFSSKAELLKQRLLKEYDNAPSVTVVELMQSKDALIKEYADFLFEKDYKPYTSKQWGIPPEEIDVSVLSRVPVNLSYDDRYFTDRYQMMPVDGYTALFDTMLSHPNIDLKLCCDVKERMSMQDDGLYFDGSRLTIPFVYTGAIDGFFDNVYGKLPYRSLVFDFQSHNTESYQDAAVVAHPQAKDFTRITEYTKLPEQNVGNVTTIAVEYSKSVTDCEALEPYYPIPTVASAQQYSLYKQLAGKYGNLYLCGRLADYKYYNMDEAIQKAFEVFEELLL